MVRRRSFIITVEGLGFGFFSFRARYIGHGALVRLVFRGGSYLRHDRGALGYLVASVHRAR